MNNKGQVWSTLFGIVGLIFGWWMAGRMEATFIWKLLTALASAVACYLIGWAGENK